MRETHDSFAEWYRAAHPGLLEDVLRAVPRPALAEDALDAAFEKAFLRWDAVRAMRSPDGWVYRVAVNAARRAMAKELREGDRLAFAAGRPAPAPPPGGETWLLVRELPIRQRTAVVLRHVGGLTEAEVAEAMGVTRSTVSSSLASAYKTLGRALAAEPTTLEEPRPVPDIHLAVATRCTDTGAHVEPLDGSASADARWSDAVRDAIKVRPGDLVAVRAGEVVWRWWGGTVVAVGEERVTVRRNVTQRSDGDPRTATMEVALPEELQGSVAIADRVWFDHDAVVAVGAPEAVVTHLAPHLPIVDALT